ncbi:Charged multivesicular body protein 7 [Coemansia sp. RSA 1290]|nr:Charged multivesicular body protein 7 [Coemansia sp. RSA 1290]
MEQFLLQYPELTDADQRAFLYSDLGLQKSDNPEGYEEAFKFWSQLLLEACSRGLLSASGHSTCIDPRGLPARLAFHGDTPMGVDQVVDDMKRQGGLVPTSEYLAESSAWRWAGRLALRVPLVGQRAAALAWGAAPDTLLASPRLIHAKASKVLGLHHSQVAYELTDNLMSVARFQQTFSPSQMSLLDARLTIRCLANLHKLTFDQKNGLIKFASKAHKPQPITEADLNAHHVLLTRDQISKQVEQLEQRVNALDQKARSFIRSNSRKPALNCLRLKKHIEQDVLLKQQRALENIERIVLQLQQSSSDVQLLQAFRSGACALKGLNQQADLLDPQSIFDEWADQALHAKEIQDAMQDTTVQADSDDEDALEAELDALLAADSLLQQEPEAKSPVAANDEAANKDADALADALTKVAISSDSEDQEERMPIAA